MEPFTTLGVPSLLIHILKGIALRLCAGLGCMDVIHQCRREQTQQLHARDDILARPKDPSGARDDLARHNRFKCHRILSRSQPCELRQEHDLGRTHISMCSVALQTRVTCQRHGRQTTLHLIALAVRLKQEVERSYYLAGPWRDRSPQST